jgi:S-adenosylmethionine-diacylgycerolhomoserine-N-methlytransferase
VFLSQDHLPYLQSKFNTLSLLEKKGFVPYMLGLKAPYYIFIGQKPKESD